METVQVLGLGMLAAVFLHFALRLRSARSYCQACDREVDWVVRGGVQRVRCTSCGTRLVGEASPEGDKQEAWCSHCRTPRAVAPSGREDHLVCVGCGTARQTGRSTVFLHFVSRLVAGLAAIAALAIAALVVWQPERLASVQSPSAVSSHGSSDPADTKPPGDLKGGEGTGEKNTRTPPPLTTHPS